MNIKKILLPVDGSENSKRAAQAAADLAKVHNAEVDVVHCYTRLPVGEDKPEDIVAMYRDYFKSQGTKHTELVYDGTPGEIIPEHAKQKGIDLIIIGSRGSTQLAGLFLGSVTTRVLHTAPCPVLVIR